MLLLTDYNSSLQFAWSVSPPVTQLLRYLCTNLLICDGATCVIKIKILIKLFLLPYALVFGNIGFVKCQEILKMKLISIQVNPCDLNFYKILFFCTILRFLIPLLE